ncbi:MAG TPA: hypothetical protein VMT61_14675 [Candidatus Binataceae bacterium]|nr:hypothetical protein [Candidatus Binataceae bacterium]
MTDRQKLEWQLRAAKCGFLFEAMFTIFWGFFAHNLPPVSPALSASDLADYYMAHRGSIMFGNLMAAGVSFLWIPWTAQLTVVMRKIEGSSPVLTIIQLSGGILTAWVLMFCPAIWAAAAFRTDAQPDTVRALSDVSFILFNTTYAVTSVQAIAAGIVGLADKSEHPVFSTRVSKWAIFTGFSFIPLTFMPFFTHGPFAWNGVICFWGLFGTYFGWTFSMGLSMIRDARRRLEELNHPAPAPVEAPEPISASA